MNIRSISPALLSVLLLLILIPATGFAGVVMPSDGPYYRLRRDHTLLVYDEGARDAVEQLAAYMQSIRFEYERSFRWKLDEENDLILTSGLQQIANAYATFSPNLKSVWYPSGSALLEDMAQSSWALTLAIHETAHLYQLNAKGDVPAVIKKIVGNAILISPFWPIFVHPNFVTPTFLVEGNAVMNESRFNMGGRLHSGTARALVLAQIQAGQIDPNRLINNQFRFPFGQTPYLQGGYFQAHLAAKYGVDKTNEFFVKQGNRYLMPLILNRTFREHFGASYPQEIREYVREMETLAKNQVSGTPLFGVERWTFVGALNHDQDRIFFVKSDGLSTPTLEIFDKRTRQSHQQVIDLQMGKVFWIDGQPRVATSLQHDLHHMEHSLYGEGTRFDSRYRGQIVHDIRGGHVVALDADNSWLEPRVLVDGEFYDIGHSQPIADEAGNIYYFRQNGAQRLLYKNRQPVFKYDGFFGKVTEVTSDGTVYFLANTDYGSSLFRYQNNEISRVLKSDRVVDARMVTDTQFFVVEVHADGHEIKLVAADVTPAQPAHYSYGFPSQSLQPAKIFDAEQTKSEERAYNSFREMRYSSMDLITTYDSDSGFGGGVGLGFTDPMEYQSLQAAYSNTQFGDENAFARYTFTKYLPQFSVSYLYTREEWERYDGRERWAFDQRADVMMQLPVLRWRYWDASLSLAPTYEKEDTLRDDSLPAIRAQKARAFEETYGVFSSADLSYRRDSAPALNMFALQEFQLSYLNKLQALSDDWRKQYNSSLVQAQYTQSFPWQFSARLGGAVAWAENHDVDVDYNPYVFNRDVRISRITPFDEYQVKTASAVRLEVSKVFDLRLYSPRIPVGLDRIAPLVVAQGLFFDDDGTRYERYPANIFEWGYGADIQILLAHIGSASIRVLQGYDTRYPQRTSEEARLTTKFRF